MDWIHIFECITQNYVLQGACGKYNSETMYNRFGGGVLGVLERQSKGDEWSCGQHSTAVTLTPSSTCPAHQTNSLPGRLGGSDGDEEQLGTSIGTQAQHPIRMKINISHMCTCI